MFITRHSLPRRTFLRGMGTAVALPFLDAMTPALAKPAQGKAPVRMAFVYVPNGMDMRHWNPGYEGALGELPQTLQPPAHAVLPRTPHDVEGGGEHHSFGG